MSRHWSDRMCTAGVLFMLSLAVAGRASAGLFDDEEARRAILDLRQNVAETRQEVESVKRDVSQKLATELRNSAEDGVQLRRGFVDLQNQLEALKSELAKLRGQNEQISRDMAELQRRQKDEDDRLRKLEPVKVTVDGKEFLTEAAERRDYDAAMAVFRKGDFAGAQVVFVDFLNRYSQSGYRPSALFWLGNAQYATKDYKEATANFRALITSVPDHVKVPEAMLAMANCQFEMKDTKASRKTLEELVAVHQGTEAALAAKDKLARFK